MAATQRDIFYRALAAYQNPDTPDAVKNYISDMVKQNPDIVPDEAKPLVQQLQLAEIDTFLDTDPATWGENFEALRRNLVHARKVWDDLPEGDVPGQ